MGHDWSGNGGSRHKKLTPSTPKPFVEWKFEVMPRTDWTGNEGFARRGTKFGQKNRKTSKKFVPD